MHVWIYHICHRKPSIAAFWNCPKLTSCFCRLQRADGGAVRAVREGERHQGQSVCQVIHGFLMVSWWFVLILCNAELVRLSEQVTQQAAGQEVGEWSRLGVGQQEQPIGREIGDPEPAHSLPARNAQSVSSEYTSAVSVTLHLCPADLDFSGIVRAQMFTCQLLVQSPCQILPMWEKKIVWRVHPSTSKPCSSPTLSLNNFQDHCVVSPVKKTKR